MARRILAIAEAIFLPRARDPLRGVAQTLAFGIVARPANQRADRFLDVVRHRRLAVQIVLIRPIETAHRARRFLFTRFIARANKLPGRKRPRLGGTNWNISAGSSGSNVSRSAN